MCVCVCVGVCVGVGIGKTNNFPGANVFADFTKLQKYDSIYKSAKKRTRKIGYFSKFRPSKITHYIQYIPFSIVVHVIMLVHCI